MTVIRCDEVRKKYGRVVALRGVSFEVRQNTCLGFLGPNGAGKTTTIKILAGLARPGGGQVEVAGVDVVKDPAGVRGHIGYLAQSPAFYNWMSGEEYLLFCAGLFKLPRREALQRTRELLAQTGLEEAARRKVGGYSGGMKQRLGIAQALINRPKVLFLDEPVSALDPVGRHELLELIRELKRDSTVFFSTHVLNDADQICDEVIILKQGEVALQATVDELRQRYTDPVFELELESAPDGMLDRLQALPYYQSHQSSGPVLTVVVKDLAQAKQQLPGFLWSEGAVLRRYQLQTPSLEQVFLRVVSKE